MANSYRPNRWEIEDDLYEQLDYELLQQILDNGILRFNDTTAEIKEIRNKAFVLIAILISFMGILIPSIIVKYEGVDESDYQFIYVMLLLALAVTSWALIKLLTLIYPRQREIPGEEPSTFDYSEAAAIGIEQQQYAYLVNQVENLQAKITFNKSLVASEIAKLEHIIRVVPACYFVVLVVSLIAIIF